MFFLIKMIDEQSLAVCALVVGGHAKKEIIPDITSKKPIESPYATAVEEPLEFCSTKALIK
jgi:hypothetical protein